METDEVARAGISTARLFSYATRLAPDPRLRDRPVRLFRKHLAGAGPPGGPRSKAVALALEFRRQGKSR